MLHYAVRVIRPIHGTVFVALIGSIACGGSGGDANTGPASGHSASFRAASFAGNCTSCHAGGSAFATESGLSLDRGRRTRIW